MNDKENTEEKVELDSADKNLWYKFLQKSIVLDVKYGKDQGWHWFWGIYEVYKNNSEFSRISLSEIKKSISDDHWLNSTTSSTGMGKPENSLKKESASILKSLLKEHDYLVLPHGIDFSKLLFKNEITFSNFIFPMSVNFIYSDFPNYVGFDKAFFYRGVDFIITKFSGSSNFNNANFFSNVNFSDATFSRPAYFHSTTFSDDAIFYKTIFSKDANFTKATFARIASFDKTKFDEFAVFLDVTFSKGASFTHAIFSQRAVFDQVKITGHTSFRNAEFKQYPPSFHKVNMYSDIIWDKIKWPILNKKSDIDMVDQNKNAYENLASHMKKLDKHDDQHFFYRLQTSCQRHLEPLLISPFYWLYEKFANYGYGIERALLWWFGHIVAGALLLFINHSFNPIGKWYDALYCSFGVSFSNAHGFLSFHKKALENCSDYLDELYWFNTIWFFQTVFGIIFLFLLLLTLRIRFRLK